MDFHLSSLAKASDKLLVLRLIPNSFKSMSLAILFLQHLDEWRAESISTKLELLNLKWERDLTEIEPEMFMINSLNFIYT